MKDAKNNQLPVDQALAMLLLSIDQELSAEVLRHFSDDTVDSVTRAMQELQEMAVDRETVRDAFQQTVMRMQQGDMALGDVSGLMQSVLAKAFGAERSGEVANRANNDILAKRPFAMFESLTPGDLANLLTEEHPQIAAVFIAHLDREKGGEVLKHLDTTSIHSILSGARILTSAIYTRPGSRPHAKETGSRERNAIPAQNRHQERCRPLGERSGRLRGRLRRGRGGQRAGLTKRKQLGE